MEQIKVVESARAEGFEEKVNNLLKMGYVLHGEPMYAKMGVGDEWSGRRRGWTEQTYVQVLKLIS